MLAEKQAPQQPPELAVSRSSDGALLLRLSGAWQLHAEIPPTADVHRALESSPPPQRISFDTQQLTAWDSALLTFLSKISEICSAKKITIDRAGLPSGVQRLLALAEAVPERAGARQKTEK